MPGVVEAPTEDSCTTPRWMTCRTALSAAASEVAIVLEIELDIEQVAVEKQNAAGTGIAVVRMDYCFVSAASAVKTSAVMRIPSGAELVVGSQKLDVVVAVGILAE